ncbi:Protein-lysine N-methyltransferase efm4 [Purpureocillium takamizusanense]|uniref:Protein-lysine N-methyltransferase EFM4 n=1 Tax=Purpureocillium takamizusanense TaxID=2060973 RepID=A0A9Q8QKD6_9HYPO|nr:Protein-lysine N-methyltransferase efm4 [Purpureocillium takamizusanense]UNI21538.1 Protein-lysine N-methyltransferase efm4 [Purpureocillium takamizusanense]
MTGAERQPAYLEPAELGTKEYWNKLYTNELCNHAADPSDIGTVWFDDSDAEAKMVEFLADLEREQQPQNQEEEKGEEEGNKSPSSPALARGTSSLLDLGCGNGSLLFALRDDGWSARALGVDYSPQSVALARQVAASRAEEQQQEEDDGKDGDDGGESRPPPSAVEFSEWDVFAGDSSTVLNGAQTSGWDVVLDKGTFDAISLSDARDPATGRRLCECYRECVLRLVRPGGIFLVTSCNWTEEELRAWFVPPTAQRSETGQFDVAGRVQYRTFSFGGVKGQTISTLCFRRR